MSNQAILNPYCKAASLLYQRIKWDIHPESWRSRTKMKGLKNKHEGEKAVILCNGPSLTETDFSLLEKSFTFGLNKINLLFDKTSFRPSCIVSVNPFVIEQNADFFADTSIPLFLNSKSLKYVGRRERIIYLHPSGFKTFTKDCSFSIYMGYTVTYVALQLAYHMGFSKIALIGCDHNFATKGPANKKVSSGEKDPNHFDPNYFSGGQKWQLPDLLGSEVNYKMAQRTYLYNDRKIFNATEGGELNIFPRLSLKDFLEL